MSRIGDVLRSELGADRVLEDQAALDAHRTDYWILAHLRARQGRLGPGPACVVRPRRSAEVATVVRLAQRHGVPIVPYGGGSGVLGGAVPPAGSLVVDLCGMNRLLAVHETALVATAQAGLLGGEYERQITARGYTTGHYPQSIERATLGGLVATRSAGQFSTKYGNIEDLLLGLEAVLPSGDVIRQLFLGSEGALGIVTEVTLRIFPLPERRALASFGFPSVAAGLDAIRRVLRAGWKPAVVRLYDRVETARTFGQWAPGDACLLLVVSEGPAALVACELDAVAAAAGDAPALGEAPVEHWLAHRNEVPSWDLFLDRELMVDTIEIAATWDRVSALYDAVVAALQGVPGMLVASAHSSHSYVQGTNLYITFAMKPEDFEQAEAGYLQAWAAVMEATLASGGTIAHHHGIGRLRVPWLERELGSAYPVLRTIKRALDPAGLMNPGALLPVR
jgi:alkyldihydroxyacetonephosphate synthase